MRIVEFRQTFDLVDDSVPKRVELECTVRLDHAVSMNDAVLMLDCNGQGYFMRVNAKGVPDLRRTPTGSYRFPSKMSVGSYGDLTRHSRGVPDGGPSRSFDGDGAIVLTVSARTGALVEVAELGQSRPLEEEGKITPLVTNDFHLEGTVEAVFTGTPAGSSHVSRAQPITIGSQSIAAPFSLGPADFVATTACLRRMG
jgi:hypothetical protein